MFGGLDGLGPLKLKVNGLSFMMWGWMVVDDQEDQILDHCIVVLVLQLSNLQQLRTLSYSETAEEEHSISMMRTVSSGTGPRLLEEIGVGTHQDGEQFTWPKDLKDPKDTHGMELKFEKVSLWNKEHPPQPNDVLRSMLALQSYRSKVEIQGSRGRCCF